MRWEYGWWFELLLLFRNVGLLVIRSGGRAGEVWPCEGGEIQVWVAQYVWDRNIQLHSHVHLTLTWHVGAFLWVNHEGIEDLKVCFLHLDDVVDCPHLTGHDRLWGKAQTKSWLELPNVLFCYYFLSDYTHLCKQNTVIVSYERSGNASSTKKTYVMFVWEYFCRSHMFPTVSGNNNEASSHHLTLLPSYNCSSPRHMASSSYQHTGKLCYILIDLGLTSAGSWVHWPST